MGIDQVLFRQTMSHFASGVTVVTSAVDEHLIGLTVSSFTSLSLEPTLVLVSIARHAASYQPLLDAGQFAVNILSDEQEEVSRRFAARGAEKFIAGTYRMSARGLPLLNGALAVLECRTVHTFPGGDHVIFVGEVDAASHQSGQPLIYYRSGYHQLDR